MNTSLQLTGVWKSATKKSHKVGEAKWKVLFERFKHWLMEPIDFPGKWPDHKYRRARYNLKVEIEQNSPREEHERRSTQS